jgi:hypothetical protein
MKNRVFKIIKLLILLVILYSTQSYASSFNVSTDVNEIKTDEDVVLNINTDKNIEAITFYLKYDSTKLEFIDSLTRKTIVKDYPEEGILRVVYLDTTLIGTTDLRFKFRARENAKDDTKLSIENLTLQFIDDATVYTNSNLEQSTFENTINIKRVFKITTGIKIAIIVIVILLVLLILVTIESKRVKKNTSEKTK